MPVGAVLVAHVLTDGGIAGPHLTEHLLVVAGVPLLVTPVLTYVLLSILMAQGEMIRTIEARIMYDMLTGMLNRNHFLDSVRAANVNGPMLIIDADHFKSINDNHGHAVGDEALRIMANAIQHCIGKDGYVGRLGGEEFGVFLPGKSAAEGVAWAEAICTAVRGVSPLVAGNNIKLSVSIGCAYHRATRVIGHSMKIADDLLYRAKADGRDRVAHDFGKRAERKSA